MLLLKSIADGSRSPHLLSDDKCHLIDGKHDILDFIAERIRVLWFYDKGRIIICSNAFLKETNKTPKLEISQAISIKIRYKEELIANNFNIIIDEISGVK
ncbi:MAG: type II toxin-antitoxin system RelE/ParE family toxin [Magnetococcales bacterium]|nr:type II toxin-antitoxin system RelE/ParE family toxin [Magnetococcales bacterium]